MERVVKDGKGGMKEGERERREEMGKEKQIEIDRWMDKEKEGRNELL